MQHDLRICPDLDGVDFQHLPTAITVLYFTRLLFPFPCRVAVVGNVDAGKSTLLGVLTHGELDNGRGFARQKLFRHKHEIESGRTSSVGNDILGFDSEGNVVNKPDSHGATFEMSWVWSYNSSDTSTA
uniref:Elongation factor 1-alpha n=1 Tax=Malurus cyaneus samueli TaxID=2593467 RepID=A0A8C5TDX5_9PASS